MTAPADWQLPTGVSRGVWDYVNDSTIADGYDAELAGTPLLNADLQFVSRHLRRPCRVLDLGYGTGRAAIRLAAESHDVVGIDLSKSMLNVAQRRATEAHVNLELVHGNIAELAMFRGQAFDAAVCLFSTLGMVSGEGVRRQVITEVFRVLRPGGQLIVHAHQLGHHLSTRAGRRLFARDIVRRLTKRSDAGDFLMPARPGSPAWTIHVFTRSELVRLMRQAGFRVDEILAVGVDGQPYRPKWKAYGLLVAASKPSK